MLGLSISGGMAGVAGQNTYLRNDESLVVRLGFLISGVVAGVAGNRDSFDRRANTIIQT
jgi:hypothetical protein